MTLHDFFDFARLFVFIPMRVLFYPFMLFPVKKNKIVFLNFNGKGYGCNPKAICECLLNETKGLDMVWLTKKAKSLPKGVRCVNIKSFRSLYEFATAKVWVSNNRLPYYIEKKNCQFYIQTWHGAIAFKQIESHIKMPLYYKIRSKHDSRMMDVLMTNSKWSTDFFRDCFWYEGEILEVGSARNDNIVNRDSVSYSRVRDAFGLCCETKVLLYAPTFRQNTDLNIFKLPFDKIKNALTKRFGGNWVVLVRLHPVLASKSDFITYNETIINATKYPDFQELLSASDFFITDYSSGLFDYIISRKPALFYAPDFEEYRKERDFAFEPNKLPCKLSFTIDDLLRKITEFDEVSYSKSLDSYNKYVSLKETGIAAKIISSRIMDVIS